MTFERRTRSLHVIQNLETKQFAVTLDTEKGHTAKGQLNFDQVVAILEEYFMFNDDSIFTQYDEFWAVVDMLKKMKD